MFIKKIHRFLPDYDNLESEYFRWMLDFSNTKNFDKIKLEKDFLLTLILIKFGQIFPDLIFKWGTCLNKVYFPYFRLSEDLDFTLIHSWWRVARKTSLRKYEAEFIQELECLWLSLLSKKKISEYTIALWEFWYTSVVNNRSQTIKIDMSIKKELGLEPKIGDIKSIFTDEVVENPIFWKHTIACINLSEALAEKIRAALTRKTPAIRDFFDVWYVQHNSDFDFHDTIFKKLVDIKLAEVDYDYTLEWEYKLLEKQIQTDLIPVLHQDYDFSLRKIYDFILNFKK